jgi:outer membrane protein assembly factor BamB
MKSSSAIRIVGLLAISIALPVIAADWPQWRGPQRNSVSRETGLLAEWPKDGPKLVWNATNAGNGFSTPSVVGDRIYLLGNEGLENEFVRALATSDGKTIWTTRLGKVGNPQMKPSYPGARSTPTVAGEFLYALGSDGDLACLETGTGKVRWQKNLRADFGGKPGIWAYAESPLIDGDTLVCTPGGSDATILALNKKTGDVLWKCITLEADEAAYASAIVVEAAGTKQYVQLLEKGLVGVDAKTGKALWRYAKAVSRFRANIPSPLASEGYIYTAGNGTGGALLKLKITETGVEVEQVYLEVKLPQAIGGAVKVGDFLYGTTAQVMLCSEFATGKLKWEERALGAASLGYADGRLYLHAESGDVALVEPAAEGYREKGRFTPPNQPKHANQMEKAWAYPVVANGQLYIRDQGTVWCYDVKAGK